MTTIYDSIDMTSFGRYLLSAKRRESITSNYKEGDGVSLEERLSEVYHADFCNWQEDRSPILEGYLNHSRFDRGEKEL